jgi:hypothetical protein
MIELRVKHAPYRDVYEGLLWLADQHQFKPAWAKYKFKYLFGKWPAPRGRVVPRKPNSDLMTWFNNQNRNYGLRQARAEAKEKAKGKSLGAAALDRVETAVAAVEAADADCVGIYRQRSDLEEAFEIIKRIERDMLK